MAQSGAIRCCLCIKERFLHGKKCVDRPKFPGTRLGSTLLAQIPRSVTPNFYPLFSGAMVSMLGLWVGGQRFDSDRDIRLLSDGK